MTNKDNVVQGPGGKGASPREILEDMLKKADDIESIIILMEFKDGTASMSWSNMLKRDLWWNISNAERRLYKILGEG